MQKPNWNSYLRERGSWYDEIPARLRREGEDEVFSGFLIVNIE